MQEVRGGERQEEARLRTEKDKEIKGAGAIMVIERCLQLSISE